MKKIANIVCDNKPDVSDIFNIVKTIDDIIPNLPTLIVDYNYIVKNFPDFDITNIYLGNNLYWTVKKTQKRDKYTEDLNYFVNKIYFDLVKGVNYFFIDIIQNKFKTIKLIIKKIKEFKEPIIYYHNDMIYIYGDNLIFGLDLKLAKYVGLNIDKLIFKIKKISFIYLSDEIIKSKYQKNLEELQYQARYIPYLVSIIKE